MENDYLWDKKGEDKEIEQLEKALRSFRYQPNSAPILPVKVLQIEEKPMFGFFTNYFKLAMTGFACLLVMLAGTGIYLNMSAEKFQTVAEVSAKALNPVNLKDINDPIDVKETNKPDNFAPIIKPPTIARRTIESSFDTNIKPTKIAFRQTDAKSKADKPIQLTAEEKEAFEQLMLALSITGEKLKEVKNKANGVEETNTIKSLR